MVSLCVVRPKIRKYLLPLFSFLSQSIKGEHKGGSQNTTGQPQLKSKLLSGMYRLPLCRTNIKQFFSFLPRT